MMNWKTRTTHITHDVGLHARPKVMLLKHSIKLGAKTLSVEGLRFAGVANAMAET